jgi:hypothetical protein
MVSDVYNSDIAKLNELIKDYSIKLNEHPNDITVLGFRISVLRIDQHLGHCNEIGE